MNAPVVSSIKQHIPAPYRVENPVSLAEAELFCKKLATSHYENFLVAGLFCPKELRQHFYNIYAYCRIADDLGDEIGSPAISIELLNWWESELDAMYQGAPGHPVFVALASTVQRYHIPPDPFRSLLRAFRNDQTTPRYASYQQVLDYCTCSANPVGRLVLYLGGYSDPERQALSDKTCTALQLANFWQDVTRDYPKNRIYLPQDDMQRFGVSESDIAQRRFSAAFAELMRFEVNRTRALFEEGKALLPMIDARLRLDIAMFTEGGLQVLRKIEQLNYDTLTTRPEVSKFTQLTLLIKRLIAR